MYGFLLISGCYAESSSSLLQVWSHVAAPRIRFLHKILLIGSLHGLPRTSRLRIPSHAFPTSEDAEEYTCKWISQPKSDRCAAQGLVRCAPKPPNIDYSTEDSTLSTRTVSPARVSSSKSGVGLLPPPQPANFTLKQRCALPKPKLKPRTVGYRMTKKVREAEVVV